jgi:hypothetical protein
MRCLILPAVIAAVIASATPAAASTPHLVEFDYGEMVTRTVTTHPFKIGGSYREVDVVDSIAVARRPGAPCRGFTLTLVAVRSGHTVGRVYRFDCSPEFGEAHWVHLKNGVYEVRQSVAKPRKGERYAVAGSVVYGVAR